MYVQCGRCYEEGSAGSMAEEGSVSEFEGLEKQLQSLFGRYTSDVLRVDSKAFCSDFRKLVEEYASRWQVPLPQLRILEIALCYFARAAASFTSNCDHVLHTLSSLALSVFELLLFFEEKDFHQELLKDFTVTFQECHLALARHQNVHLLQVERLALGGGPWASPSLQAILSGSSLPQSEVAGCISSELPVFFELRVRYLLSCERVSEAMALAKCCAWHPTAGQHLFFLQVYLTWLFKTSEHDKLCKELADFNGEDAIHIICSLECEEKDELLLALSRAFLSQQLRKGDMHYLCDLVFVWSKLHHRLKTSKQVLLEEINQLMRNATNINSIFPFVRAVLQEVGEEGIQFCIELCANALGSCPSGDAITKSLIYKTIAGLLPNDLEVCRACALLIFFLERTVEAYKTVYLLYMHPDQEYNVEYSPIRNHVRFETLQILKKDLYFDPEFWNLINLRTNCIKLMNEKVVSASLEEIMEDKWILNYCTKEPALRSGISGCQKGSKGTLHAAAKKRHRRVDTDTASKRLKMGMGPGQKRLNAHHTVKRKGKQGTRLLKDASSKPLRRSFWQLERLRDNGGYEESRRTTRLSEKNLTKRRIRKPKWLLEDAGALDRKSLPLKNKKHGLKHPKHHLSSVEMSSDTGQIKNNAKHKLSAHSHLTARESNSRHQKSLDGPQPAGPPQVILELSLPDNELLGSFSEDTCNRQRGIPQVLLYKRTVKLPPPPQPVKTVHGKEVILRARDLSMFVQQLHCYSRRQKGRGNGSNIQGSVSTITRSSAQGSPPKDRPRKLREKPAAAAKAQFASHSSELTESESSVQTTKAGLRKTLAREFSERCASEMKGTVPSQTPEADKVPEICVLDKVPQAPSVRKVFQTKAREHPEKSAANTKVTGVSQTSVSSEVTGAQVLDKVRQAQARKLCEESAVEMKVTVASQTPTVAKVAQSPGLDKVSKAVKDVSTTTPSDQTVDCNNQVEVTEEIPSIFNTANISNIEAINPTPPQSHNIPEDVSQKLSEICQLRGYDANPGRPMVTTQTPTNVADVSDLSALTLVTEMVTELAPETLARQLPTPEDSASKESTVPRKQTTSSSSILELGASADAYVQGKNEGNEMDIWPEMPDDGEHVESEESKLEYCCTFCNKVFKGSRVVAHAMFHYRKDECMFCGTMFRDDLLAMMHLSDHIEKLKRIKDTVDSKARENCVSETKDESTPKTSAKSKTTNISSGRRSRGRPRKPAASPQSISPPDSPSASRKLRSNDKPGDEPSPQETKQNIPQDPNSKAHIHKVNGHIGKKRELDRLKKDILNTGAKQPRTQQEISGKRTSVGSTNSKLQRKQDQEKASATSVQIHKKFSCSTEDQIETTSVQLLKTPAKHDEKVCCPLDSCSWFTDPSKNRVALLYHALEDHYGEIKPLELAFLIGNGKCSICMRVLWSFEHFLHHIERHRLTPRHPCLHQGCTARFKTGMEMRRHARRHSPLQAVCCLPGCSKLFICLWALNLHEREHYASKPTKQDKSKNRQTRVKHNNKELDDGTNDQTAPTAESKTVSGKATHKSKGQATHNATRKHAEASSSTTIRASLLKRELKWINETKDSHVLKNLSNKNTSTQPPGPSLRLKHKRKMSVARLIAFRSRKVNTSSLLKRRIKVREKLKKNQVQLNTKVPKRRGRPPKSKESTHDENTTDVEVKADHRSSVRLASPSNMTKQSNMSKTLNEKEKRPRLPDAAETPGTSINEFTPEKSTNKQIKKNPVQRKVSTKSTASAEKTQNSTAFRKKNLHPVRKRFAAEEDGSQTVSKKQKVANIKANVESNKCPLQEPVSHPVVPQVDAKAASVENSADEGKAEVDNDSANSVPANPANSSNEIAAPAPTSEEKEKGTTEEKSKKKLEKREKNTGSDSRRTKKKHDDKTRDKKTVKGRRPCKDGNETKKTAELKSVGQEVAGKATACESSPDVEERAKEEASNADGSGSSVPAATSPPAASEEKKQKAAKKKPHVTKKTDPDGSNVKRKVHKDGDSKVAKKKPKKPKTEVEGSFGDEGPQLTTACPGDSVAVNGEAAAEALKYSVCIDTLAAYGKKPFMRLPPTAYLAERFITMPKRRKEMPSYQSSQRSPERTKVPAAPQRQRCANCFATFSSAEELQGHLQLQKCSNLFGFDSDDEGNS